MIDYTDPRDAKRFTVGEPVCLYTTMRVRECPHCAEEDRTSTGDYVTITSVDHDAGKVVIE